MKTAHSLLLILITVGILLVPSGCLWTDLPTSNLPSPPPQLVLTPVTNLPPHTTITEGPDSAINQSSFTFRWSGSDEATSPDKLIYTSFLEGYDPDWTAYTPENSRAFVRVPNGSYTFYVKAQDDSGNIEQQPAMSRFTIAGVVPAQPAQVMLPGTGGFLLVGGDVSRLAVAGDGVTIYALDALNARLYRSDTAGLGWTDLSSKVGGSPPWVDVAVAPDNPALVAVLASGGREAYISDDAGANFTSTGLSSVMGATQAGTCLAVSPDYGAPQRDIAVGSYSGTGAGGVYLNVLSRFSGGWMNASSISSGWAAADVFAVEFSPSYAADGNLLCVASSPVKSYLYLGVRDLGTRDLTWNPVAGYPVELSNPGAGTPGTPLNYADISLPSDFNSSMTYSRHAFVSWSKNHPAQGVYHIIDSQAYRMNAPEPIASIAYWGTATRGKLLAGAVRAKPGCNCAFVQTYFTANPMSVCPACPMWQPSQKSPTGQYNARVAWSPDGKTAYAGTTGIESAFSHSVNNGYTWNQ